MWGRPSINVWDDGYPSGGNYWSEYAVFDEKFGTHQNLTGSDGIWDAPYIIDVNNRDAYPLIAPFNFLSPTANFTYSPEFPRVGEPVTFNASLSTSNGATNIFYKWDFGDGNIASDQIVKHAYLSSGVFTVVLTVTNNRGISANITKLITVYSFNNTRDVIVECFLLVATIIFSVIFVWLLWKSKYIFIKRR